MRDLHGLRAMSAKESGLVAINQQLYQQREERFNDIVALRKPDRVPVMPLVMTYFPTRRMGMTDRNGGYDNSGRYDSCRQAVLDFGWDWAVPNALISSEVFEAVGALQVVWPGGGLPDNVPFQFVEKQYMAEEEYDEFLEHPDHFVVTKLFPRIAGNLSGFGVPLPPLFWFCGSHLLAAGGSILAQHEVRNALASLLRLADAAAANDAALGAHVRDMAGLGYPYGWIGITVPAFDVVSDFMRGLKGSSLDIYRQPDKLLQAIAMFEPMTIELALQAARVTGIPRVFIPMHRGADNFMRDEDFRKFYWPGFKRLIDALVDAGITPMPLFEGGYSSRLGYLAQLPPGKVAAHFDFVDRRKFKEVCGDVMCFWGNVPSSILCTGTPQQVTEEVKRLIDLFGDSGTLMLDGNVGIPDEARPENVYALREAADAFGKL
jgi:hypothetical protein